MLYFSVFFRGFRGHYQSRVYAFPHSESHSGIGVRGILERLREILCEEFVERQHVGLLYRALVFQ